MVKKVIQRAYHLIRPKRALFKKARLCGVPLKVLNGTIRTQVDQDDAWWFYLSKHHNVIFDIGANIGYTALLALIQNPNREMILVDPNPEALGMAASNIIQNNLGSRTQYLTAFVSDKPGNSLKFYTVGAGAAGSMYASHAETASSLNSFINVNTVTLDHIYQFYNLKPDLVKIDVEGAETLVMQAAIKMAAECQCSFFIEMHNVENLGMEAAGDFMVEWCTSHNYKAWYLKTGEVMTSGKLIAHRGKCHLLLLPSNKAYPDYLIGVPQNGALPKSL